MDKEQYIKIIGDHRNLIYKICFAYCSDPEDRKDLQQDILVRLWHGLPQFDGRVKLSTWIYTVSLNTAISFYRKERKRNANQSVNTVIFSLPDNSGMEAEKKEEIEQLYRFIEELKELDKALILLYLDDVKYSEISQIIGITESNVATKINRIKKKLKEKFEQHSKEE